jgi:heme/copper-type cytochrome/quinol oxidase subunit 3
MRTYHNWHIVTYSPWPFFVSIILFSIPLSLVGFFKGIVFSLFFFYFSLFLLVYVIFLWFDDIIIEASGEGYHTEAVQKSFNYSMLLFIFSEVMFFFGFFWAFFWLGFAPSIELNLTWPPNDLQNLIFNPFEIPLLNTIILLTSGATITISHFFIKEGKFEQEARDALFATLFLAFLFLIIQLFEYFSAPFDISDGAYASVFYICTGFHGFHVIIGAIFISFMLKRLMSYNFSRMHHFGFEAAAWYWHFVDVVWLFLYILIYYWGSDLTHLDYDNIFLPINEVLLNMEKDDITFSFELKDLKLDQLSYLIEESKIF